MSLLQDVQAPRFRKTGKSTEAAAIVESLPQQTKVAHATAQKLLAADKRELAKQLKGQVKDTAAKSKAKPKAKGKAKAKAGAKAKKEK